MGINTEYGINNSSASDTQSRNISRLASRFDLGIKSQNAEFRLLNPDNINTIEDASMVAKRAHQYAEKEPRELSPSTVRCYESMVRHIEHYRMGSSDVPNMPRLGKYHPGHKQYCVARAALVWDAQRGVNVWFAKMGHAWQVQDKIGLLYAAKMLAHYLRTLIAFPKGEKSSALMTANAVREQIGKREPPRTGGERGSKKKLLPRLPKDWRHRMWSAAAGSKKYRLPLAVIACCGCRPAELKNGVTVKLVDGDQLYFRIEGVKVDEDKGHKLRSVTFALADPEAHPEFIWLRDQVRDAGGEKRVNISDANAFGMAVSRFSKNAFPRMRNTVTPYVYRHAVAQMMKTDPDTDQETIAQVLGHITDRTQRHYGTRKQKGSSGLKVVRSWSSRKVKLDESTRNRDPVRQAQFQNVITVTHIPESKRGSFPLTAQNLI